MVSRRNKATHKRRSRKADHGTTVEGLHASFSKIDDKVKSMIAKGKTDSDLSCCIRKAWTEQFHMDLSLPAIKGMILHYRAIHGAGKRKTRKAAQKGGMAPVDWTMGQGITDHVYGRFPVEMGTSQQVLRGMDLGRFYENPGGRSCDATGGHAAPGQQLGGGDSQTGGGILDALFAGHAPHSVPRNVVETTVSAVQGRPITNPSASPIASSVPLAAPTVSSYDASKVSPISSLTSLYQPY